MMIKLRDYQQDLIARTREALRGSQHVLMQAPTGAGKTALACHMMQNAVSNGHSCMFLVHQNELLQQTSRAMWHNQIAHGMVTPSRVRTPHPVQVASIMTLKNRLKNYKEPALIIIDECLHGETLIQTSKGVKKIKDIRAGDLAMTYKDGCPKYSKVTDTWCSGIRDLYEIRTVCNRVIKCTENHKIKTQRGWVRADQLTERDSLYIANAAAEKGFIRTGGAGSRFLSSATKLIKEAKMSGRKSGQSFLKEGLYALAGAGREQEANTRKRLNRLFVTRGLLGFTSTLMAMTDAAGSGFTSQAKSKSRRFTEHFSGIARSYILTQAALLLGCSQTTGQTRESAQNTRRNFFMGLALRLRTEKTRGMARLASGLHLVAWSGLTRFTKLRTKTVKKQYQKSGSTRLDISASHGGCAMTDRSVEPGYVSIPKGFRIKSKWLLKSGSLRITEMFLLLVEAVSIRKYTSKQKPGTLRTEKSETLSPNQCDISLSSVKSVIRLKEKAKVYDITVPETSCFFANGILVHNCHRAVANTYQEILKAYPAAKVVGLTATPQRTDGKGLNHIFSDIVQGPSIRYLIEQGYLCDYQLYGTPQTLDLSSVRTTAGDFNAGDVQREAEKPKVVGDAIDHYLKFAHGKRCVVMCATIKQAESMAKAYKEAGVPAGCIHGNTKNREEVLAQFAAGEILILTSVQLLIEGVDIPEIGAVQWLRPTKSIVVYMQGNGRGLRPHGDKNHLVILDHVGNWQRHGLPCEERVWSLDGDKNQGRKKADPDAIGVQTCEQCFSAFRTGVHECPYCGHEVQFKERKIDTIDGELEAIKKAAEVEREKLEARKEQGRARELSELVQIGINRKMRNPSAWAANVFAARQGRKASSDDYARARQLMVGAV